MRRLVTGTSYYSDIQQETGSSRVVLERKETRADAFRRARGFASPPQSQAGRQELAPAQARAPKIAGKPSESEAPRKGRAGTVQNTRRTRRRAQRQSCPGKVLVWYPRPTRNSLRPAPGCGAAGQFPLQIKSAFPGALLVQSVLPFLSFQGSLSTRCPLGGGRTEASASFPL